MSLPLPDLGVLNGPGPPQGPARGLSRALDGTGGQKAVRSRPGNLRTAIIVKDGGPYNVRQIGVGERAGLRGTAGDCGGLPGTAGDCRGRRGTAGPLVLSLAVGGGASLEKDRTGRHDIVHRGPPPGRTDCPVENAGFGLPSSNPIP